MRKLKKDEKARNENRGITLVALVVTIVVLLILASITITYMLGDNSVFKQAQNAKDRTEQAKQEEQEHLGNVENTINKHANGNGGSEGGNGDIVKPPEPPTEQIEEKNAFSRANGVIDIVWLNIDNTVRPESEGPISPANCLGGLTAIKYDGTKWVEVDTTNTGNSWYNYVAQTGNIDEKKSNWANAVANFSEERGDGDAYFVWIPRYAYKITYFDTTDNANAYRVDHNSKTGIIGYSNINGMIDVSDGTEKLVKDSEPSNVTGTVKTAGYADYIPHPAFEFDGGKAGIWVGKFESSGSTSKVTIIPNTSSLVSQSLYNIFSACQGVKTTYSLTGDSHMMKNTEWGAVAYLAESKYGRNGTEIGVNDAGQTGGGLDDAYKTTENVLQSTTGNITGIYDMSGCAEEYVAGICGTSFLGNVASKYYNTYTSYSDSKRIKGDAVFETSRNGIYDYGWHSDFSTFPEKVNHFFRRGRLLL